MSTTNDKKRKQLGMAWGTANGRLQRMILFHMVQKTEEDICFHCHCKIDTIEEFSVEHKEPWLDQDPALFWDITNIAFSHMKCNYAAARKTNKVEWPEGYAWCWDCKTMKTLEGFPESKTKRRTIACTECCRKHKAKWRKQSGKH